VAVVALTSAIAAGCASDDAESGSARDSSTTPSTSATTSTTALPGTFTAGIAQYREDETTGTVQIELRNDTGIPIVVHQLSLGWEGMEPQPPTDPNYTLHPDVTVALTAPAGRGVCPTGAADRPDPATAAAHVAGTGPDGQPVSYQVAVTGGLEVLDRIRNRSCEQQTVEQTVRISFGPTWTRTTVGGVPALAGSVVAERTGRPDPVVVDAVHQNGVLFNIDTVPPKRSPVLRLAEDQARAEAPIAIVAASRCYGHALGDAKKIYEFHANLRIDGAERAIDFSIPTTDQSAAYAVVTDTCAGTT